MSPVRNIWRSAPRIGTRTRVYCGVTSTDGRSHYCVVANDGRYSGPRDRLRRCIVLGYQIDVTLVSVDLSVKVRMASRHPLIQREHFCHVSCLEKWAAESEKAK